LVSHFLVPSQQKNNRKSIYCHRKYFSKKNVVLPLDFQQNVIAGTKWAKLSRQLHLAHLG